MVEKNLNSSPMALSLRRRALSDLISSLAWISFITYLLKYIFRIYLLEYMFRIYLAKKNFPDTPHLFHCLSRLLWRARAGRGGSLTMKSSDFTLKMYNDVGFKENRQVLIQPPPPPPSRSPLSRCSSSSWKSNLVQEVHLPH